MALLDGLKGGALLGLAYGVAEALFLVRLSPSIHPDWEFAAWSDPYEDLGWLCARCWRFGNWEREAGGLGSRQAFYVCPRSRPGSSGAKKCGDRGPHMDCTDLRPRHLPR